MSKFKLSLPLRIGDLRDSMLQLVQELSLLKTCFRESEISSAQGQMLLEIDRSGPINVVSLTALLNLDKSTVSQTLAQLQKLELIELVENQSDRRYKKISLTPQGANKVANIHQHFDEKLEQILGTTPEAEKNAIAFGMGLFAKILEDWRFATQKTAPLAEDQLSQTSIVRPLKDALKSPT